jgi:Ca2+-binding RTX toxin-like protein
MANLTFTETTGGAGDITLGEGTLQNPNMWTVTLGTTFLKGFSYPPPSEGGLLTQCYVKVNHEYDWADAGGLGKGSSFYLTLLHEIGHSLGLDHSFSDPDKNYHLTSELEDYYHTVMTYDSQTTTPVPVLLSIHGSQNSYWRETTEFYPTTLMPLDIQALQYLYGKNWNYKNGNDTYTWDVNPEIFETIWDGGGNDTINCANQVFTCVINLQEGGYSSISLRQTRTEIMTGLNIPTWFTGYLPTNIYTGRNNLAIANGAVIENAIGGAAKDTIYGNAANNVLEGRGGNDILSGAGGDDTLNGGGGSDAMSGGAGNDRYYVDTAGDTVTEMANAGTDLVVSSISYTLGANLENLYQMGSQAINGFGNDLANTMTGNSGDNTLNGMAGQDILIGNDGNDTLNGGVGADTMYGGMGNDRYYVDTAGDTVTETANAGTDLVVSSISYTLGANLENLYLTGSLAINGTGNALNNTLSGNTGENILDGGAGADTLLGGAGDDRYYLDNANDKVTESANQGYDRVYSSVTHTLSANVEFLWLQGSGNLNGTGNNLNNYMVGTVGNNILNGGAGVDTLVGLAGNDTLMGAAGDDNLSGDGGADSLYAGEGNDWLRGGAGSDRFAFTSILTDGKDTITDFQTGSDRLMLSGLGDVMNWMRNNNGYLPSFCFVANNTGRAWDANDRILYNLQTGALYYDADGNGSGAAVQFATLSNAPTLRNTDILAAAA